MTKKQFSVYMPTELVNKGRGLIGYGRPYSSISEMMTIALEHELEQYTDAQLTHWEYITDGDDAVIEPVYQANDLPATQLGPPIDMPTEEEYSNACDKWQAYVQDELELSQDEISECTRIMNLWHDNNPNLK